MTRRTAMKQELTFSPRPNRRPLERKRLGSSLCRSCAGQLTEPIEPKPTPHSFRNQRPADRGGFSKGGLTAHIVAGLFEPA